MDCDAEVGGLHTDPDAEDLRILHRPHGTQQNCIRRLTFQIYRGVHNMCAYSFQILLSLLVSEVL